MKKDAEISIIIPTFDDVDLLRVVLEALNTQILKPNEIVVIDSSSNNKIKSLIHDELADSNLNIVYRNAEGLGPNEAKNLGATKAAFGLIGFLDTKTIPADNWLKVYSDMLFQQGGGVIFGKTRYLASTNFQKLLRDSTYGNTGHETAPGSLLQKNIFFEAGQILTIARSGIDIEWRDRLKAKGFSWSSPEDTYLTYNDLPNNLILTLKKFFFYQMYGAMVNIQNTVKEVYLGLLLILSAIIIPQWNGIVGWDQSPLYLPYITRVYLITLVIIFLSSLIINKGFFRNLKSSLITNIIKAIILALLFIVFFRWNDVVANWVEESIWYIPNITKIYVISLIMTSVFYRGIYFPLKNEVGVKNLFPIRWLAVGILGVLLDLAKAPGYLLGSIMLPFIKNRYR